MNPKASIRKPAVSGQFYPDSPQLLRSSLGLLFAGVSTVPTKKALRALIVPHAGYLYSGATAATAFAQLDEEVCYDRIFLIGSSHQAHFAGIAVADADAFSTPLGVIPCDVETTKTLRSGGLFAFNSDVHTEEHSLEVLLPFLQMRLKKPFRIVPLLLGTDHPATCVEAAKALKQWFNPRNLFVISTDFSHYPDSLTAVETDRHTTALVTNGDPDELYHWLQEIKSRNHNNLITAMCGAGAVMTLLNLCKTDARLQILPLHYSHSGEAGRKNVTRVVGYQSMMVVGDEQPVPTDPEKEWLLGLARQSIENHITGNPEKKGEPAASERIEGLTMGAFVSIYANGKLRGCIGRLEPKTPLQKLIPEMALAAAFSDKRFKPVAAGDLPQLGIEISLLTPLHRIERAEEFEPHRHGILIRQGHHSGTFLPQVAKSTGWSRTELLRHCSEQKAGLGPDGWKTAELYVYEAIVFRSDEDPADAPR